MRKVQLMSALQFADAGERCAIGVSCTTAWDSTIPTTLHSPTPLIRVRVSEYIRLTIWALLPDNERCKRPFPEGKQWGIS